MDDDSPFKQVVKGRCSQYVLDSGKYSQNDNHSIVFDLLNTSIDFGLTKECLDLIENKHYFSKQDWKRPTLKSTP